ncbi:exodeoxyribonuclease VII small subunit [Myxococcus qinghaiensis]|uniref:exodeoxyribonuclease VII small subunit n=1 Tax=Myxococcus qinghaiensis TaxID=2906758 RepID=UPI0020A70A23|nr:exodeoxyribonuclease VII small subunit [Myxococcus qinghaiensis]MCP3168586.1 exodeoxyribonuclease VII small subunit [Myxococcus qinghaiensis]
MAKADKASKVDKAAEGEVPGQYGDVVSRLEETVGRLESGNLSLEDSLKAFEEGIRLVRRGEKLLTEAEQRIEQLLQDEDGNDVVAPLSVSARPAAQAAPRAPTPRPPPEDDVPF